VDALCSVCWIPGIQPAAGGTRGVRELKVLQKDKARSQPVIMHPVVFVSAFLLLGALFALQEWIGMHLWNYHVTFSLVLEAWSVQYFLWGVFSWLLWWRLGPKVQQATLLCTLTRILPLSIAVSIVVEMIWVLCFPNLPLSHAHMAYWHRLNFHLHAELIDNMVIFWCVVALFRGIGYYEKFREKEDAAAQLEVQLAQAQIQALRMQLNPHFLFNAMNSISSLMQSDVVAADTMLEQLSSLLRISLERGQVQLIPLSDEIEFVEMYMAMQGRRYAGRLIQEVHVDPELHDALVPAMILQPLVENAYVHGISRLECDGLLVVEVGQEGPYMVISVLNSGTGLHHDGAGESSGQGVGLANVKDRLRLHYGDSQRFSIQEVGVNKVEVTMKLPLQFQSNPYAKLKGYGA